MELLIAILNVLAALFGLIQGWPFLEGILKKSLLGSVNYW